MTILSDNDDLRGKKDQFRRHPARLQITSLHMSARQSREQNVIEFPICRRYYAYL